VLLVRCDVHVRCEFRYSKPTAVTSQPWPARADSDTIGFVIRKAFRMSVDHGKEAEYERRHRPIWPELEEALRQHGVRTYSIFLDAETNHLFGYVEVESEAQWAAISTTDVCQRWWQHMRDIMPAHPDASPISRELREVFHVAKR
jgi:L-rhamnose mutarotase